MSEAARPAKENGTPAHGGCGERASGVLHVVGTPIGNLGDLTPRAAKTLGEVDFIAAEDTRVTQKLLAHLHLRTPMVSHHEHNRFESGRVIADRIAAGESCALVSDAGMPAISDPGAELVALCAERGLPIQLVPGPSALTGALALSGFSTGRFCFEGFLSTARAARMAHLKSLVDETRTMVFYEAPHKLSATLVDLYAVMGNRRIVVARELTKLHEECLRLTLREAVDHFVRTPPRGEFVLIVEGAPEQEETLLTEEEAVKLAWRYIREGYSLRDAARRASSQTGHPRRMLYEALLGMEKE